MWATSLSMSRRVETATDESVFRSFKMGRNRMIDLQSARTPLTVHLPADLVAELQRLAAERRTTVDELMQEACLSAIEPEQWERCYREWERANPGQASEKSA